METVVTTSQQPSQDTPPQRLRYVPKPKGSWKKLIGRAKNDDLSLEAFRLGAEWREQMNREGH
ncbi:MAG TPA: hypothetical protein DDZ88_13225 [Verrucomicrobiales bacterium]|nr:hypothetical protein [Verrucomicrobiales bacterium]